MNFDDLKDRLKQILQSLQEKIIDSSVYAQLRDRYENLTPFGQRLSLIVAATIAVLILFSLPWSNFSNSQLSIAEFEERRNLIRDMFKVNREASSSMQIPIAPDAETLRSRIQNELQQARLLPEQIINTEILSEESNLIPSQWLQGIIKVSLAKLNLRQVVDLGYQLTAINSSVKMKDLEVHANYSDPRYFDASFKLAILKVPNLADANDRPEEESPVKKRGRK